MQWGEHLLLIVLKPGGFCEPNEVKRMYELHALKWTIQIPTRIKWQANQLTWCTSWLLARNKMKFSYMLIAFSTLARKAFVCFLYYLSLPQFLTNHRPVSNRLLEVAWNSYILPIIRHSYKFWLDCFFLAIQPRWGLYLIFSKCDRSFGIEWCEHDCVNVQYSRLIVRTSTVYLQGTASFFSFRGWNCSYKPQANKYVPRWRAIFYPRYVPVREFHACGESMK